MKKRRTFTREFKLQAVKKVVLEGMSFCEVARDLETPPPKYQGRGAVPKLPFMRVDKWRDALTDDAWTKINVRDGEKGPLEVEVTACRVQTKIAQRVMKYEETLVIARCLDAGGVTKYDFYFSNAPRETALKEFARVALAAHRVEESIKRGKSQAGLADYEVRNWRGWHHHQALSLLATWFLVRESHRGKKSHAGNDRSSNPRRLGDAPATNASLQHASRHCQEQNTPPHPKRTRPLLPLQGT